MKYRIFVLYLFVVVIFLLQACNFQTLIKAQSTGNKPLWKMEVDNSTKQCRLIYKEAKEAQKKADYKKAYELFKSIEDKYDLLQDFILLNKAEIAEKIPDEFSVIKNLKSIIEKTPESPLAGLATYSLGQAYVRIKNDENAKKYFELTISKYPNTNFATASNYYLAEINAKTKENRDNAISQYKTYLKNSPDGMFAINSAKNLQELLGQNITQEDKILIGLAYFNSAEYNTAIKFLKGINNSKSWYALGKCYQNINQSNLAVDTFIRAINSLDNIDVEEVDNAIKYIALTKGNNLSAWSFCEVMFPKHKDIAYYFEARMLKHPQAILLYNNILKYYPNSRYAPEASWEIFWDKFNNENYQNAINIAENHIKKYPDSKSAPRIIYWTAKAYEKLHNNKNAVVIYNRLINHFPGDYYSYRAEQRLNEIQKSTKDNLWSTNNNSINYNEDWKPSLPYSYEEMSDKLGNKFTELVYLEDNEAAKLLLKEHKDALMESYFELIDGSKNISMIIIRKQQPKYLKKHPSKEKGWQLLYPLHYSKSIKKHAGNNFLDPLLVQALTREESYFNPQAISSSSALGLMQLLPSTAKGVAQWLKDSNFNELALFDPETNLKFGSRYLKYTHDTFLNNSMLAVAAYNAGPNNVKRWLKSISTKDMDQFVENIPIDETKNYVKKVFASYWNYKTIYSK